MKKSFACDINAFAPFDHPFKDIHDPKWIPDQVRDDGDGCLANVKVQFFSPSVSLAEAGVYRAA